MEQGVPYLIPPRWVDPAQRPQRCRQTTDRLTKTSPPPYRFDPRKHTRNGSTIGDLGSSAPNGSGGGGGKSGSTGSRGGGAHVPPAYLADTE